MGYKSAVGSFSAPCCALSDVSAGLPWCPVGASGNPQFPEPDMPKSTLIKSRQSAFAAQGGNCNYCGHPMWESQPEKFSQVHGVRLRQVWRFKCTAEHLVPRESGGRDSKDNIVAACAYCNFQRHRARPARDPEAHRAHVQRRLAKGRWHSTTGYILSQT